MQFRPRLLLRLLDPEESSFESRKIQLCAKDPGVGDFAGLGWVDRSYLLFVEPRLIGDLDVVSVRVDDVCREVVGTPFGPKAWFLL